MQQGYELLFMAARSQRVHGKPILDMVMEIARSHDIHRHTRRTNTTAVGEDGRAHAMHFFELDDEPEELLFVLGAHRSAELLQAVRAAALHVFCVRRPIEFGHMDEVDESNAIPAKS